LEVLDMGWTSYYRKPGESDRDHIRREVLGESGRYQLLECATVANVFYAAVRTVSDGQVWALVVLQRRGRVRGEAHNYARKELEETMGPSESRCPARVLDLLSPLPDCGHAETYCVHCGSRIYKWGEQWVSVAHPGQHAEVAGPRCFSGYPVAAAVGGKPPAHAPGGVAPCGTCIAREWRERCRAEITRRANQAPLTTGATFTVARPWTFLDDVSEQTFTLIDARRRLFRRRSDGRTVRLPARDCWPEYTVLQEAAD
jgi:hypothetical protein